MGVDCGEMKEQLIASGHGLAAVCIEQVLTDSQNQDNAQEDKDRDGDAGKDLVQRQVQPLMVVCTAFAARFHGMLLKSSLIPAPGGGNRNQRWMPGFIYRPAIDRESAAGTE